MVLAWSMDTNQQVRNLHKDEKQLNEHCVCPENIRTKILWRWNFFRVLKILVYDTCITRNARLAAVLAKSKNLQMLFGP